jgi:carbonic anhydrase/acetyltransferase-like protein (isoleucine patch superfamily)
MIMTFLGKTPKIKEGVFIAPTAVIIGDVTIGAGSSVWFNAVIRGDVAPVHIGQGTNIQDNCTLHTDTGVPLNIGDSVTVGHNAIVHGCRIGSGVLIGMGAVVLNHAEIGEGSIVAAKALVREKQCVERCCLVAGIPAQVKKNLGAASKTANEALAEEYKTLTGHYRKIFIT